MHRPPTRQFLSRIWAAATAPLSTTPRSVAPELKDSDKIRICDFLYSFHDTRSVAADALPPGQGDMGSEPDDPESITFEASLSSTNSHVLLEAQPAEKIRALIDITNNLSNTLELDSLLPKIVDSLFQLFKQADRGFIILREETIERDKPVERLIPKVIKTRRPQNETATSYSRSIVKECLKTVQAFLSDDAARISAEHEPEHCRFRIARSCAPVDPGQ